MNCNEIIVGLDYDGMKVLNFACFVELTRQNGHELIRSELIIVFVR
jgi:hypothetical protein